jgi:hypothetical protein
VRSAGPLLALCLLAACGGDGSSPAPAPEAGPEPSAESRLLAANCAWLLRSDPDLLNIAFPDEGATYWVAAVPAVPGARLRIEAEFPQARYFSFNTYDPALRPTDVLTDYRIDAADGLNPYRGDGPSGRYVAWVEPGSAPETRAANTLYAGQIDLLGRAALPNPVWALIYRLYLPEVDRNGGVALPSLQLEVGRRDTPIALQACDPLPPDGVPGLLNDLIRNSSDPGLIGLLPFPLAPDEPEMVRFYGLPETLRLLLSNAVGFSLPLQAITAGDTGGGFLSNLDNAYVTTMMSRERGSLYVLRAQAPSWAGVPADAPLGSAQVRYWSLCTNEFVSQRYVGCLHDAQVPLDGDGYFTLVVSDPDQRPANATDANGIAWLPWGAAYPDSVVIYRHMLPSAHFTEAIQNIGYGTPVREVMGAYAPEIAYCTREIIEAATSAADAFARCR